VLDPRISYGRLKSDYAGDPILLDNLEDSKGRLATYFDRHYTIAEPTRPSTPPPCTTLLVDGSPQKSFTARYRQKDNQIGSINELEEYFKLRVEDFESCNPIRWWVGRRSQFPRLYRLARDILCIPGESINNKIMHNYSSIAASALLSSLGSAVAVERIFSGGRDTISLRRASLQPDTIRFLMLVKKRLHLARAKAKRSE
jgi:hypothetical protein